jgi:hypothetical protein
LAPVGEPAATVHPGAGARQEGRASPTRLYPEGEEEFFIGAFSWGARPGAGSARRREAPSDIEIKLQSVDPCPTASGNPRRAGSPSSLPRRSRTGSAIRRSQWRTRRPCAPSRRSRCPTPNPQCAPWCQASKGNRARPMPRSSRETAKSHRKLLIQWSRRSGLNRGPADYEELRCGFLRVSVGS